MKNQFGTFIDSDVADTLTGEKMFLNHFRIALRSIKKDKLFSILNVTGLAVGIACFLTLSLYIIDELSYDKFYKNSENIYRVYVNSNIGGIKSCNSKTAGPLGQALLEQLPEVTGYTRIGYFGQYRFRYKEKVFNEWNIYAADSSFFSVFSLQFIEGDPKTALNRPNTIVITETAARKYFGNINPVGKSLIIDKAYEADYLHHDKGFKNNKSDFLITGVIKDFPENSHFRTEFLTSISSYNINQFWIDLWYSTYIVLKDGTDPHEFDNKLQKVVADNVGPLVQSLLGISMEDFYNSGNKYEYHIQPLTSIYLYSQRDHGIDLNTEWSQIKTSDISYVYIFSAVALFILLIAVINFMNLSTARSGRRSREVGIRKTLGSSRTKLMWQFISEAILMSSLSVFIAIALLEIILPLFNGLSGKNLKLEFISFYTIPALFLFILVVGVLAGSYPAFYLSSFQPVKVLKAASGTSSRKSTLRSTLVILQFTISITLLISTIVIKDQLNYIQNKNLGFEKDHLYSILNANCIGSKTEAFKNSLLQNSNIISVSNSSQMFRAGVPGSGYLFNQKHGTDPVSFQFVEADYDFIKTYQVKLKQGRFFSKEFSTDSSSVLINETAAKVFGDTDPTGKEMTRIGREGWAKTYKIIGVIKDFNYESLHQQVRPLAIHLYPPDMPANVITIKISSADIKQTIEYIETTWEKFTAGEGMYAQFVDENLIRLYEAEEKTGVIASVFSGLAIFIACLGLFGLAAFVTEQRTKEIGIRKVLGASVTEIIMILSKEFAVWVLVANIISWPIAYYAMQTWLQNFAFRTDISWYVFAASGLMALIIALFTVGMHAVKAAQANPVDSLKYE